MVKFRLTDWLFVLLVLITLALVVVMFFSRCIKSKDATDDDCDIQQSINRQLCNDCFNKGLVNFNKVRKDTGLGLWEVAWWHTEWVRSQKSPLNREIRSGCYGLFDQGMVDVLEVSDISGVGEAIVTKFFKEWLDDDREEAVKAKCFMLFETDLEDTVLIRNRTGARLKDIAKWREEWQEGRECTPVGQIRQACVDYFEAGIENISEISQWTGSDKADVTRWLNEWKDSRTKELYILKNKCFEQFDKDGYISGEECGNLCYDLGIPNDLVNMWAEEWQQLNEDIEDDPELVFTSIKESHKISTLIDEGELLGELQLSGRITHLAVDGAYVSYGIDIDGAYLSHPDSSVRHRLGKEQIEKEIKVLEGIKELI